MNREAWGAGIHGVTKSWTRLSKWTELNWTERKNVEDKKIEERKRLIFLCLHRKPVKPWDKELALFMEATGALPVSWGSEDAEHFPVQVLETQADKWTQRASMLQEISLKKRVRERKKKKKDTGWPSFGEQGPLLYFQKGLLYLNLYIEGNERCKVIQSQPKDYICFAFIKTRIFSAYLSHEQYCVHYLLALEACEYFMTLFW